MPGREHAPRGRECTALPPRAGRAALDPVGDGVVVHRVVVLAARHERAVAQAQLVAHHAGAQRAQAGVRLQATPPPGPLLLPLLHPRRDEVGAAGAFLHGQEEGAAVAPAAASPHLSSPPPLCALLPAGLAEGQGRPHQAPVPLDGGPLLGVPPLVLGVHGEEAQHHQVEESPDDGKPYQDVHKAEGHIGGLLLEIALLLQRHKVPEADGGERDEAVVVGLEEAPVLVVGEGGGAHAQRADAGEEAHRHHVLHGHVGDAHAAALLDALQQVLDEGVHALAQALEHHQRQRDAQHGVEHAEGLASIGARGRVPVTWRTKHKTTEGSLEARSGIQQADCAVGQHLWGDGPEPGVETND